jgi:hypothetical protein
MGPAARVSGAVFLSLFLRPPQRLDYHRRHTLPPEAQPVGHARRYVDDPGEANAHAAQAAKSRLVSKRVARTGMHHLEGGLLDFTSHRAASPDGNHILICDPTDPRNERSSKCGLDCCGASASVDTAVVMPSTPLAAPLVEKQKSMR